MDNINLNRLVYDKTQFENTIDTKFSQLVSPPPLEEPLPTIEEFFSYYNKLFFNIPQFGNINSHEYLIKTSTDYIKPEETDPIYEALIAEINDLRRELLSANERFNTLQNNLSNLP
jgi:hypothetical protein